MTATAPSAARALQAAAARRGVQLRCHLKIDTGMNRLGFRHDNLRRTLPEVAACANLAIDAVYTHFATADDPESAAFAVQRERFEAVVPVLDSLGIRPRLRHDANSAALLRDERVWYDFVRPGLLLYGVVPPPLAAALTLRPALSLHTRIVHVKGIRPGEGIGYGHRSAVETPMAVRDRLRRDGAHVLHSPLGDRGRGALGMPNAECRRTKSGQLGSWKLETGN